MWGSQLDSLSWRIDLKTKARHIEHLNEPTAIIEMKLKNETEKVSHGLEKEFEIYIYMLFPPCIVNMCEVFHLKNKQTNDKNGIVLYACDLYVRMYALTF